MIKQLYAAVNAFWDKAGAWCGFAQGTAKVGEYVRGVPVKSACATSTSCQAQATASNGLTTIMQKTSNAAHHLRVQHHADHASTMLLTGWHIMKSVRASDSDTHSYWPGQKALALLDLEPSATQHASSLQEHATFPPHSKIQDVV